MNTEPLLSLVQSVLENGKAQDCVFLNVMRLTDVTDYMVICTATSSRHAKTLAEHLVMEAKAKGVIPLGVEGEQEGDWVLVDLGDVIVHVMLSETRAFYQLEKLWAVNSVQG